VLRVVGLKRKPPTRSALGRSGLGKFYKNKVTPGKKRFRGCIVAIGDGWYLLFSGGSTKAAASESEAAMVGPSKKLAQNSCGFATGSLGPFDNQIQAAPFNPRLG